MPTGLNTARLYTQLLNTGLQQKDPALYQVIYSLIQSLINIQIPTSGGGSGGGGGSVTIPDIALSALSPSSNEVIPSNNSAVIVRSYLIASGRVLAIQSGARLRIL